jgi:PhoH-like ATPase
MHDPTALFRFQEHNIFIPMIVLEELDHAKKGLSDVSRNVRQVSRFLDELIRDADQQSINDGLPLSLIEKTSSSEQNLEGRLYFQTRQLAHLLPS